MFDTRDGLFDCSWSEENERILLSASGDGTLKVKSFGRIIFILFIL